MSSQERTGWRDESFSKWHRTLAGPDGRYNKLCMMNIDSIWMEYDSRKPVGLFECKHESAAPVHVDQDANCQTMIALADMAGIGAFGLRYAGNMTWIAVAPLNSKAVEVLPTTTTF